MDNLKVGFGVKRRWRKSKTWVLGYEPATGGTVPRMVLQSAKISRIRARL